MLKNFRNYVEGETSLEFDKEGKPSERDLIVGVVVLLLELAHSDDKLDPSEISSIVRSISKAYSLSDAEVAELIEVAEILRQKREKVQQLIENVNAHYDDEQRQVVLSMVWNLIRADGRIEKAEQQTAIKLRSLLNLSLEQAARALQMAEERR